MDISLYPISYAGGEFAELNIGLMPGLVSSYKQGAAWKKAPVGQKFSAFLAEKGVIMVSWIWQAGGCASRGKSIVNPEDAKGMKIRGGSREFDMLLQAAGATTLSTPSNELYAAMQTGACDATYTSSTSLISFRLEEVAKSLTSGRGKSYWFMLEPLIMSKQVFDALSKKEQDAIMAIGLEMEEFGTKEAMADDQKVSEVYAKKGLQVADLNDATVEKWRAIARDTAWKDYAGKTALSAELLKLAEGRAGFLSGGEIAMSHGLDAVETEQRRRPLWSNGRRSCRPRHRGHQSHCGAASSIALVVAVRRADLQRHHRYFLHLSTDWQDETVGLPDRRRGVHVGGCHSGRGAATSPSRPSSA